MKPAAILFSHGSTLCGAGDALDAHAERLRESGEFSQVEVGYMNYSEPTFEEAVTKIIASGTTRIIVIPFFLVPGYFVTKTLPERIASVQTDFPDLEFVVAPPLGADEKMADALIAAARKTMPQDRWRDGLKAASRACRKRSDCPLYDTPDCPATFAG